MEDGGLLKVFPNPKQFMIFTFIVILLLICFTVLGEEKPTFTKSNCVIEVIYDEKMENEVSRRMICTDGVVGVTYWQLFDKFYY